MAGFRIAEFDVLRLGYGGALVTVYRQTGTQLASLFYDQALTDPAPNPQQLASHEIGGQIYGMWSQPVYTAEAYRVSTAANDTGVVYPPLTTLFGAEASYAVSSTARGGRLRRLIDRFDDLIHARDFGDLNQADVNTTTATLAAAVGAAAGQAGGTVLVPAGVWEITALTLPAGVVLMGESRESTTIVSREGSDVITLGGDGAGLVRLTLDGVNLVSSSVGVVSEDNDRLVFDDVLIKRFVTGVSLKAAQQCVWTDLSVENCSVGMELISEGGPVQQIHWDAGSVETCTVAGVRLEFGDALIQFIDFQDVRFDLNTGTALDVIGARFLSIDGSVFGLNTRHLDVSDGTDAQYEPLNRVISAHFMNCLFGEGQIALDDTAQDFEFRRCLFDGSTWILSLPQSIVTLRDCIESPTVTATGDRTKLMRWRTANEGEIVGVTSDGNWTTAYEDTLDHGEVGLYVMEATAERRNGRAYGTWMITRGGYRPPAQLAFDGQVGNFTVGTVVTGDTSGATARIVGQDDAGVTGVLYLKDVIGTFQDNEAITDTVSGVALVNGTLSAQNAVLDPHDTVVLRQSSDYCTLAFEGQSSNFSPGDTITGGTSGATGILDSQVDSGATGVLTLSRMVGVFQDGEALSNGASGDGDADGVPVPVYAVRFIASVGQIQAQVLGAANQIVDWVVRIRRLA